MATEIKIIEKEDVTRDYGFLGTEAIIEHPEHGRILIMDGYGELGLHGGAVRWSHGMAIQLKPGDTIEKIKSMPWNEYMDRYFAMCHGYDDERPVLEWSGNIIEKIAERAGL